MEYRWATGSGRTDSRGADNEIGAEGPVNPLASIARHWGFTDPSSFARVFRAAYGMSPREWRDQNHPRTS